MDKQLPASENHVVNENPTADKTMCTSVARVQTDWEVARRVGHKLAQLREAKHWKIDDVSAHLKVPVVKLEALEAGALDTLPDMIFVAGIVRSYAKIFDVDPMPFIDELRQARHLSEPQLVLPESTGAKLPRHLRPLTLAARSQRRRIWGMMGVFALILTLFVLLFHRYGGPLALRFVEEKEYALDQHTSIQTQEGSTAPAMHPQEPIADVPKTITSEGMSRTEMQSDPVLISEPKASIPEHTEEVQHIADHPPFGNKKPSTLHFKVSQETWISVRQGDDQKVYTGLLGTGEERDLSGTLPLYIVVGNISGLESLELDGQPVERSKYTYTKNNVARFSLP